GSSARSGPRRGRAGRSPPAGRKPAAGRAEPGRPARARIGGEAASWSDIIAVSMGSRHRATMHGKEDARVPGTDGFDPSCGPGDHGTETASGLDWLYGLQRFGMKLGLENTLALCGLLRDPQHAFAPVLVGGTNGKGSIAAMLEAILRRAGVRTGLYTSP